MRRWFHRYSFTLHFASILITVGSHVARAFAALNPEAHVVLASRKPSKIPLRVPESASKRLTYASVDIAIPSTLRPVFQDANVVVSLVGILHGNKAIFEAIQWKGAENVAMAAQEVGAKLVHLSAIGADANSPLISPRTKGLGELSVLSASPAATIIRPSLVFGPGDSFFTVCSHSIFVWHALNKTMQRFATLSRFLPVMPVFGGGKSKFQPVYVGDLARLITLCSHSPKPEVANEVEGAIIEAGGPDSKSAMLSSPSILKSYSFHLQADHGIGAAVYWKEASNHFSSIFHGEAAGGDP